MCTFTLNTILCILILMQLFFSVLSSFQPGILKLLLGASTYSSVSSIILFSCNALPLHKCVCMNTYGWMDGWMEVRMINHDFIDAWLDNHFVSSISFAEKHQI